MPFDPDVFGGGGQGGGFDPEVFATPRPQPRRGSGGAAAQIENDAISQGARDNAKGEGWGSAYLSTVGGMLRGAGSIGATLLRPFESGEENQQRRAAMDAALSNLGADTNSFRYQAGKLGAEVAGTAGVGGALAAPVRALGGPTAQAIAAALETGGFRAPGISMPGRMLAGGVTSGAAAGMVDPEAAGAGFVVGAALPPAVLAAGRAGQAVADSMRSGARNLMQSAVKPTLAQLRSGDAATAIDTMLQNGISPNARGVERVQGMIDSVDDRISNAIAGSTARIDKSNTLGPALQTRAQFGTQASPVADLQAVDNAISGYLNHPTYPQMSLPVQDAQAMKQGTYRVLAKKYGQMGSADIEAQKAIARGLKEEIANAVPSVAPDNAQLSRLLSTMDVIQRRALMEGNKNPIGLSALAGTKAGLLGFMADRSAALKALAARGMYSAAPAGNSLGLLSDPALLPFVRGGLLASEANP